MYQMAKYAETLSHGIHLIFIYNRIIAVTFIGILTYTFAEEASKNKTCDYKPMENFDSTRYLQMTTLYSTYAKLKLVSTDCRIYKLKTDSNGKIDSYAYGYYKESGESYYYEAVCNFTKESMKTGKYFADCKMVNDTYKPWPPLTLYMAVVDTDYENYAILYSCISDKFGFSANFEVLQKNPGASDDPVKEALKKKGMNLEEFFYMNTTYCQNLYGDEKKQTIYIF